METRLTLCLHLFTAVVPRISEESFARSSKNFYHASNSRSQYRRLLGPRSFREKQFLLFVRMLRQNVMEVIFPGKENCWKSRRKERKECGRSGMWKCRRKHSL